MPKTSKNSLNRDYLRSRFCVLGVTNKLIFSSFFNIFYKIFQDMSKTEILAYLPFGLKKNIFWPRKALFAHFWENQKLFFLFERLVITVLDMS